jgi:hypothetical protein
MRTHTSRLGEPDSTHDNCTTLPIGGGGGMAGPARSLRNVRPPSYRPPAP